MLAVGPGVSRVAPGDHVVASFLPACGTCRWCASGRSNLCNLGATIATGQLPTGTWPFRLDGAELGAFCMVGAFARHSLLHESSVIKIHPWLPLDTAALMACSVPTGWARRSTPAAPRPGDTVVVVGCGGVGANAVQGAVHAGASHVVAVDPVAFRRDFALTVGATHAVETSKEAAALARELTWGNGADVVVLTLGSTDAESTRLAARCLGKGGTLVLTALADVASDVTLSLQGNGVTAYEHRIQGALFGSCNAHRDVPMLLRLAEEGKLELDRLVTRRYSLDHLHQGFADQAAARPSAACWCTPTDQPLTAPSFAPPTK